jgi:hypothetical protein
VSEEEGTPRARPRDDTDLPAFHPMVPAEMENGLHPSNATPDSFGSPTRIVNEHRAYRDGCFGLPGLLLRSRGVKVTVLQDDGCIELMRRFIREQPVLWNEDSEV